VAISRRPDKFKGRKNRRPDEAGAAKGFVLLEVEGRHQGKEFCFEEQATLGRVEGNDIVVIDPGVSRQHCRIAKEHGAFVFADLGSANGTRLNGEKIAGETEVLRDGDYITLGETTFRFSALEGSSGDSTAETQLSEQDARAIDVVATNHTTRLKALLRTRRGKLIAAAALLVVAGAIVLATLPKKGALGPSNLSGVPITYSDEDEVFNAVFGGYGPYDQTHPEQAQVEFQYLGGKVTLQYGAWGIDKVGEVDIMLNDNKVGTVPLTLNRWVYGLTLVLPVDKLKQSEKNLLVFKNTRNPPNRDPWGICYLRLIQEVIPPPDPRQAQTAFDGGKKAWEDREIDPSNMFSALIQFKRARDLLEAMKERPSLYNEANELMSMVDRELTRRFQDGQFAARRAERVDRDLSQARTILIKTLRYFGPKDFRHRELKRYLEALAGG
jgi:pSer/pThr/pTyr-binding forkhead associated (FHA) protein